MARLVIAAAPPVAPAASSMRCLLDKLRIAHLLSVISRFGIAGRNRLRLYALINTRLRMVEISRPMRR